MDDAALSQQIQQGLYKIGMVLRAHAWKEAYGSGLSPTQGAILAALLWEEEGLSLKEVANALGIRPPTASDAVHTLVTKGWVTKGADPEDGRQVRIRLTPDGRRVAGEVVQWPEIMAPTLEVLSREEKVALLRILLKMIRSFQEKGQISPARMCLNCQHFHPHRYPGTAQPHYCAFVEAPFGEGDLRVACPDFQEAPPQRREEVWSRLGWRP